jgi:hypothetical protein
MEPWEDTDVMTSVSVFPLRLDETDRYLLRRLALERGQSANAVVTMLVRAEIDRALPGAERHTSAGVRSPSKCCAGAVWTPTRPNTRRRVATPAQCSTPQTVCTGTTPRD